MHCPNAELEGADRAIAELRRRLDEQDERVESCIVAGQVVTQQEAALGMLRIALAEALVHRKAMGSGLDGS